MAGEDGEGEQRNSNGVCVWDVTRYSVLVTLTKQRRMRLIIPLFFILVGAMTALLVRRLFGQDAADWKPSVIAGAMGSLFGLGLRDLLDQLLGDAVYGALIAAILGAAVLSILLNVATKLYRIRRR